MTSFNHYALGAVADWMHRVVGGIAPAAPGYRRVRIAPRPGGDLTWAETSVETRHGRIAVRWERDPTGRLDVDLVVPGGVTAEIDLPGAPVHEVGAGHHRLTGRCDRGTPLPGLRGSVPRR
jgi:alpha-L-rhamnosidase